MVGLTIVVIALSIALLVLVALFLRQRRRIRKLAEQAEDFLVGNGAPLEFSVQEDSLAPLHNAIAELQNRLLLAKERQAEECRRTSGDAEPAGDHRKAKRPCGNAGSG